jgi:metK: methionine adenosyltransferase
LWCHIRRHIGCSYGEGSDEQSGLWDCNYNGYGISDGRNHDQCVYRYAAGGQRNDQRNWL